MEEQIAGSELLGCRGYVVPVFLGFATFRHPPKAFLDLFAHKYWVAGGGVGHVLNRFATLAPLPFEGRLCTHITAQIV